MKIGIKLPVLIFIALLLLNLMFTTFLLSMGNAKGPDKAHIPSILEVPSAYYDGKDQKKHSTLKATSNKSPIPNIIEVPSPFYAGKDQQLRTYTDRDFISPVTMKAACDWHYGRLPQPTDMKPVPLVIKNLKHGQSIFVDTTDIEKFRTEVLPGISTAFVLVTGDSQHSPNESSCQKLLSSKLVLHMYAMHCNDWIPLLSRASCIPIGISQWKGTRIGAAEYLNSVRKFPKKENLLLANFKVDIKIREEVFDRFCNGPVFGNLTTCVYSNTLTKQEIYNTVSLHSFILSPRGHGIDCYRTYEALLMGSFPIVKTSALDGMFEGMPVLIVKEWDLVTVEVLEEFKREWNGKSWDNSMLFTGYWWRKFRSFRSSLPAASSPSSNTFSIFLVFYIYGAYYRGQREWCISKPR
jgi:hypothetical protein